MLAGIDFGSKTAGTTVICFGSENIGLSFLCSNNKQDTDEWLIEKLKNLKPNHVFIDAPLSFPLALLTKDINGNFLYRKADEETGAMSPLFLGTYSARAIKLMLTFNDTVKFFETYPAQLLKTLNYQNLYSKKQKNISSELLKSLNKISGFNLTENDILNTHYLDAYLCWISGLRYLQNKYITFGNREEGLIFV
ncbi:MAG: hypothetical protein ACK4K9_03105 [Bacteroidia bacterium]